MEWVLIALVVVFIAALGFMVLTGRRRSAATLADARAEAQRWYERLGGQLTNLPAPADQPAVRQAMVDAGERYNAAGGQLAAARTPQDYERARETALEGLTYIRAARQALGFDPGPDLPPLAVERAAGKLTKERAVDVQGHRYVAGPNPGPETPYFYPGGMVAGRPVPRGWYSEPWWKTALATGAGVLGGMLLFNALFSPMWGDPGYDADQVAGDADDFGDGGADSGAAGGDYEVTGEEMSGDAGGGDAGGGDYGGGDFGGGDF